LPAQAGEVVVMEKQPILRRQANADTLTRLGDMVAFQER
jgi:hypothetical protein